MSGRRGPAPLPTRGHAGLLPLRALSRGGSRRWLGRAGSSPWPPSAPLAPLTGSSRLKTLESCAGAPLCCPPASQKHHPILQRTVAAAPTLLSPCSTDSPQQEVLQLFDVDFDFPRGRLRLFAPGEGIAAAAAAGLVEVRRLSRPAQSPYQPPLRCTSIGRPGWGSHCNRTAGLPSSNQGQQVPAWAGAALRAWQQAAQVVRPRCTPPTPHAPILSRPQKVFPPLLIGARRGAE